MNVFVKQTTFEKENNKWVPVETEKELIDHVIWTRYIKSSKFFRAIGGYERYNRQTKTLVSISPDKQIKIVREFTEE